MCSYTLDRRVPSCGEDRSGDVIVSGDGECSVVVVCFAGTSPLRIKQFFVCSFAFLNILEA